MLYIYIYTNTYLYTYLYIYIDVNISKYTCVSVYTYICIHMYIYVSISMYVYKYIYIYIHLYTYIVHIVACKPLSPTYHSLLTLCLSLRSLSYPPLPFPLDLWMHHSSMQSSSCFLSLYVYPPKFPTGFLFLSTSLSV